MMSNVQVDNKSAYEIAVANGFVGSEQQWLDSLHGEDGRQIPISDSLTSPDSGVAASSKAAYDLNNRIATSEDVLFERVTQHIQEVASEITNDTQATIERAESVLQEAARVMAGTQEVTTELQLARNTLNQAVTDFVHKNGDTMTGSLHFTNGVVRSSGQSNQTNFQLANGLDLASLFGTVKSVKKGSQGSGSYLTAFNVITQDGQVTINADAGTPCSYCTHCSDCSNCGYCADYGGGSGDGSG